ncbi:hypothetical protein GYH30_047351 [Glycine max]|nr:hypothetical protein GYH30_047351 [Glycine max]
MASKIDPILEYDFCVAFLSNKWHTPPSNLKDFVVTSIQQTKSNATNMVSIISNFLKNKSFDPYVKDCLRTCFDLYSDSVSALDNAVVAFKNKDFDTASTKVSVSLDSPVACQGLFNDKKGENKSPLTKENRAYFEFSVIPFVFIQMCRIHN